MKKLRSNKDETALFIKRIQDKIDESPSIYLSDFSIEDIKKDFCTLPAKLPKPIVMVDTTVYMKMLELINQSSVECSWHGLVRRVPEDNTYYVYDILVFPQINSSTTTTTDEEEFAKWQMNLICNPEFPYEDLRLHGHSHVNMNVFSSGVDDKYQSDIITKVENGDYYIFFIMNKKMEICIFLYDFEQQIMFDTTDIDFQIVSTKGEDVRKWAKNELKEKATVSTPKSYNGYAKGRFIQYYDDEEQISYFSKAEPVFKGVKNESK